MKTDLPPVKVFALETWLKEVHYKNLSKAIDDLQHQSK